jgi:hypothetical protein
VNTAGAGHMESILFASGATFAGYALADKAYSIDAERADPLVGGSGNDVIASSSALPIRSAGKAGMTFSSVTAARTSLPAAVVVIYWPAVPGLTPSSSTRPRTAQRAAPDRIADIESGLDKIDLSGIDANTGASGNQGFNFVSNATPSVNPGLTANSLSWYQVGANTPTTDDDGTIVQADTNGNAGTAELDRAAWSSLPFDW